MTFNKEYIEQVRKGEAAIWNIGKLKDTKALQEVHDICCPEDNWEVLKGFVYYGTNDGKYFWLSNDPLPPGMEAIPLKDFFEDEPIVNGWMRDLLDRVNNPKVNEVEVTENKVISNEDEINVFLKNAGINGERGELRIDQLKYLLSQYGKTRYKAGIKIACDITNDSYGKTSSHPYLIGDCVMAKLNVLDNKKVRKNISSNVRLAVADEKKWTDGQKLINAIEHLENLGLFEEWKEENPLFMKKLMGLIT